MPQAVDQAGNIWEVDAQGNAVRLIRQGRPAQTQPQAVPLPTSPRQVAQEGRDNAASGRDEIRTGIAVRGEGRDIQKTGFDNAKNLRDEFNKLPDVQDYRAAIKAYTTALKTSETPAGDLNLIYAFAKIMDPNSVVREGEQAAVAGGDTMAGQMVARLRKELGEGGTFRQEYRNQLRQELQNRVAELNNAYEGQRAQYGSFAGELGVDPDVVLGQHDGRRFWTEIKDYWEKQGAQVVPSALDARGNPLPSGARVQDEFTMMNGPGGGGGYRNSYAGQTMSGVNKGIGTLLGAPVDLATAALNLVPQGINAAANTKIPRIQNPVLGSEWINNRMGGWGIYDQTGDPNKQFARRVGESVGASLVPLGSAGLTAPRLAGGLLAATGGGIGGAGAQRAFPGNPTAEMAGEILGSGVTMGGLAGAQQRMRQRAIEANIPTIPRLKEQAGELYRQAEARGVTAGPAMTQQLAQDMRTALRKDGRISPTGRISEVYPKAKEAVQLVDDYAGMPMNPTQIQTVRGVMSDGLNSPDATERRTASMLTDIFDTWADPQATELRQARAISQRYLNAQKLEQARELADVRASQFTNSGPENALRTQYRELDRNAVKGKGRYNDDLTAAIENVSRGTPASNFARNLGRLAPTGPLSFGAGTAAPAAAGTLIGGPALGAAVGATTAGAGILGRVAATGMTERAADIAELVARNGGNFPRAPLVDPETQRAIAAVLASQQATFSAPPPRRKEKRQKKY